MHGPRGELPLAAAPDRLHPAPGRSPPVSLQAPAYRAVPVEHDPSQQLKAPVLLFEVEDILGIGQLKSGKFRKVITKFNLKKAVEEIMQIQQYSADLRNIKMEVEYLMGTCHLVKTDKKRIQ